MTELNTAVISNTFKETIGVTVPVGAVLPYAGHAAPTGWALCDGAAVSRTTYAKLFIVLATTYGAGNGSSTFNLPDLRGRVVAGDDDMGGVDSGRKQLNSVLYAHGTYNEDAVATIGGTTGGTIGLSFIIKLTNDLPSVAGAYPVAP